MKEADTPIAVCAIAWVLIGNQVSPYINEDAKELVAGGYARPAKD